MRGICSNGSLIPPQPQPSRAKDCPQVQKRKLKRLKEACLTGIAATLDRVSHLCMAQLSITSSPTLHPLPKTYSYDHLEMEIKVLCMMAVGASRRVCVSGRTNVVICGQTVAVTVHARRKTQSLYYLASPFSPVPFSPHSILNIFQSSVFDRIKLSLYLLSSRSYQPTTFLLC